MTNDIDDTTLPTNKMSVVNSDVSSIKKHMDGFEN